jgi:hypothetical protein
MKDKEVIIREIQDLSPDLLQEVIDFARFLKGKAAQERFSMALLSEAALAKDWLRPEEDEAWHDL